MLFFAVAIFLKILKFNPFLLFIWEKAEGSTSCLTSRAYSNKLVEDQRPNSFWVWLTCWKKQQEPPCSGLLGLRRTELWDSVSFRRIGGCCWRPENSTLEDRAVPCGLHQTCRSHTYFSTTSKWERISPKLSSRLKRFRCEVLTLPQWKPHLPWILVGNGPSSTIRPSSLGDWLFHAPRLGTIMVWTRMSPIDSHIWTLAPQLEGFRAKILSPLQVCSVCSVLAVHGVSFLFPDPASMLVTRCYVIPTAWTPAF